jgi:hypothetical protein
MRQQLFAESVTRPPFAARFPSGSQIRAAVDTSLNALRLVNQKMRRAIQMLGV